jgi:hypothetical protein
MCCMLKALSLCVLLTLKGVTLLDSFQCPAVFVSHDAAWNVCAKAVVIGLTTQLGGRQIYPVICHKVSINQSNKLLI